MADLFLRPEILNMFQLLELVCATREFRTLWISVSLGEKSPAFLPFHQEIEILCLLYCLLLMKSSVLREIRFSFQQGKCVGTIQWNSGLHRK